MGPEAYGRGLKPPGAFRYGPRSHRVSRRGGHRVDSRNGSQDSGDGLGENHFALRYAADDSAVACSRAQSRNRDRTLREICAIGDRDRLTNYPFYFAALGELELGVGKRELARERFLEARILARNEMERQFLDQRLAACEQAETTQAFFQRFWERQLQALKEHVESNVGSKE
jgi:hypothetical protein